MSRTTTLRNGKEFMKRAQAATGVDGAMEVMTLTRAESPQVAMEVDVMEIDNEDVRPTPPIDMDQALGRRLANLHRNRGAVDGGTTAEKQHYVNVCSEVKDMAEGVEIWKS
ncbi:hypothetical protein BGZ99_004486 [Dissophora globulifera]|uniref:Uncharacterized protein n=1 Tax=Dissophora globulifera TaxID=979702 RepID=A0A9P6RHM7_9FUNG|nr:hypothetical protein BGZ99_004486 [Dissophora globulifera]